MRVRGEHWNTLLNIVENNPEMITNKYKGANGRENMNKLWQAAANKLNSLGYGEKTVDEWKKAVIDWKSKTKAKARKLRLEQGRTGGGVINTPPLSEIEERLIQVMGKKALEGDAEVAELGLGLPDRENVVFEESHTGTEVQNAIVVDHSYISTASTSGTSKRVNEATPRATPSKRRRCNESSSELIQLSRDTLEVLKQMNSSLATITNCLEILCKENKKN